MRTCTDLHVSRQLFPPSFCCGPELQLVEGVCRGFQLAGRIYTSTGANVAKLACCCAFGGSAGNCMLSGFIAMAITTVSLIRGSTEVEMLPMQLTCETLSRVFGVSMTIDLWYSVVACARDPLCYFITMFIIQNYT